MSGSSLRPAHTGRIKDFDEEGVEKIKLKEPDTTYIAKRRDQKINGGQFMVPLVPVSAQAGYSKSYTSSDFIHNLDVYPIVPGIDPHGAIWRYFQVEDFDTSPI